MNKRKRRTWKDKLYKKERNHLNEMGIKTKRSLIIQRDYIKKELDKFHNDKPSAVCWDCHHILKKLGMMD